MHLYSTTLAIAFEGCKYSRAILPEVGGNVVVIVAADVDAAGVFPEKVLVVFSTVAFNNSIFPPHSSHFISLPPVLYN